jgi:uncharacterized OB-fold protein
MVNKLSNNVPIGFKCLNCGKIHYPKHARCLKCKHRQFKEIELPSEGSLLTYTILKVPPTGINKNSLILGIIDLEKVRYTGQLEVEQNKLRIGMRLKAVKKKVREIDNEVIFGFVWYEVV